MGKLDHTKMNYMNVGRTDNLCITCSVAGNQREIISIDSPAGQQTKREAGEQAEKAVKTTFQLPLDTELYHHGISDPIHDYRAPSEHQCKVDGLFEAAK